MLERRSRKTNVMARGEAVSLSVFIAASSRSSTEPKETSPSLRDAVAISSIGRAMWRIAALEAKEDMLLLRLLDQEGLFVISVPKAVTSVRRIVSIV